MLIKMNVVPTFENIKEFFKNNVSDLHWIRIQVGFNSNYGCAEEYRLLGHHDFEARKNNYIFGNAQTNYFVLKYTPISYYESFNDWDWDWDDDKVYVPVPLTPRNLKDVVCFFAQNKCGSCGKYLPEVGNIEIRNFANSDWTFGPSYSMCDYFNDFKQAIGISKKTRGFLTNKLVDYLLVHVKAEMQLHSKFLFDHGPHTNFVGELESNPAFVKVV